MWLTKDTYLAFDETICRTTFLDTSDIHSDNDWYYPLHAHNWYDTVFCVHGSGTVTLHTTTFTLREGMAMIVKPNVFHSFFGKKDDNFRYCVLAFLQEPFSPTGQFFEKNDVVLADFSDHLEMVRSSYKLLFELYHNGYCSKTPLFYSVCIQLMHLLQYAVMEHPLELPLAENTITDRVLNYIQAHYKENITLKSISEYFSISVPHISRIFKQTYNISLINYLIDYRLCLARDFLFTTELDIQQISEMVGYQNVSHFSRLFLKRTGYTPLEYRKLKQIQFNKDRSVSMGEILAVYGQPARLRQPPQT